MKRILLILAAIILCGSAVKAQSDYKPLVVEGRKWTYYCLDQNNKSTPKYQEYQYNIEFNGDTLIDGKIYKRGYRYVGDKLNTKVEYPWVYMREENQMVYSIKNNNRFASYPEFGWFLQRNDHGTLRNNGSEEALVYNFLSDTKKLEEVGPDNIRYQGCVEAGVGFDFSAGDLFTSAFSAPVNANGASFPCGLRWIIDEKGDTIHKGCLYKRNLYSSFKEGYRQVYSLRGVGDGGADILYNIEFKGSITINGKIYKKCYRYVGDKLDENKTVPLAFVRSEQLQEYYIANNDYKYSADNFDWPLRDCLINDGKEHLIVSYVNFSSRNSFALNKAYEMSEVWIDNQRVNTFICDNATFIQGFGIDSKDKGDALLPFNRQNSNASPTIGLHHIENLNGDIVYCGKLYNSSDYNPMVVEGRTWTYFASHYDGELGETGPEFLYNITIDGTTEIGGVTYHNAYRYKGDKLDKNATQPAAYLREDGKKVYAIMNTESDPEFMLGDYDDSETVLYDFEAPLNPQWVWSEEETVGVTEDRFVTEDAVSRRVWRTNTGLELIEGIGLNNYYSELLAPIYPLPTGGSAISTALAYVSDLYGNIIFKGINYGKKPYTPLVSRAQDEGLKFVYYAEGTRPTAGGTLQEEKYVYKIELKGQTKINGINYTNVYRYRDALASDAVPCAYVLETDMVVYGRRNAAYKPDAAGFDRNIAPQDCFGFDDEDAVLYDFKGARLTPVTEDGEWVESQTTVDGMDCLKWMFRRKGDDKYIRTWIEGIGVDDRFGDLVTPDYAPATGFDHTTIELHHVEKADGEIIYKGTAFGKWAGIEQVSGDTAKTVAGVRYYNLLGVESAEPFSGVNVVVTTYTDGSRQARKVIR